jgi:type I restriction enzyme S subunit
VPFYRSKEIIELHNTGQTKGELYISEDRYNEIVDKFGPVVSGDILLTSVGTLGIPYRVNQDDRFYFKDGNLTWFKDFTKLPSLIILYWLKSDIGKEELDAIAIGSTQAALTINSLKSIQLALPPIDIINKLEEQLIVIDNKLQANLKQIKTLENMRDTLLPKLMSGEVRVNA